MLVGRQLVFGVLMSALAVHLLMLAYDIGHPEVFFNADRAISRWSAIQGYLRALDSGQAMPFLAGNGIPGDYALHALLYWLGGKPAVILAQVGLALIPGYAVYRTGLLIGLPATLSTLACGIYMLLPHSLIFPHQLSSEALHSPLLIVSLWMTAEHLAKPSNTKISGHAVLGALLAGATVLIRPITLLWPFFAGFIVT